MNMFWLSCWFNTKLKILRTNNANIFTFNTLLSQGVLFSIHRFRKIILLEEEMIFILVPTCTLIFDISVPKILLGMNSYNNFSTKKNSFLISLWQISILYVTLWSKTFSFSSKRFWECLFCIQFESKSRKNWPLGPINTYFLVILKLKKGILSL